MKLKLPQYSGKDNLVMAIIVPAFSIILCGVNFGAPYFSDLKFFLLATAITIPCFALDFTLCGLIAVAMKNRFPREDQMPRRLAIMITAFLLLTILFLYFLLSLFESVGYFNYKFREDIFLWSFLALGIINIFLTFLMEGISRFNEWQKARKEMEKLSGAYKKGQLQGLKSHVNPHFLFNSLNSLSSLIHEDEEAAERFLNEMTKVYRYMLQNDEDQLVPLDTELKFLDSYFHLLKARYGEGLQIELAIKENDRELLLAPLTLQVIIENAFSQNVISRANPLLINISCSKKNLLVQYRLQPKSISDALDFEAGLDNLVKKYELLNMPVTVYESETAQRFIQIPMAEGKKEAVV